MRHFLPLTLLMTAALAVLAESATAGEGFYLSSHRYAQAVAANRCWHGGYYDSSWGAPVALVVPPTAEYQTKWGWGVSNTRVVPIYHQFGRNYPGPWVPPVGFQATPLWPSDTDQFGDYYVRGPWK